MSKRTRHPTCIHGHQSSGMTIFRCLVLIGIISCVHVSAFPSFADSQGDLEKPIVRLENARQIHSAVGKVYDFSTCAPEYRLLLGDKILNKRQLYLSTLDGARLAPMLHNETLADRMHVWGEITYLAAKIAEEMGRNITTWTVEKLDKFEGDIVISRASLPSVLDQYQPAHRRRRSVDTENTESGDELGTHRAKRKIIFFESFKWKGTVNWMFADDRFTGPEKNNILKAIEHWQDNTCIRFKQTKSGSIAGPHIKVKKLGGCWSFIGQQARGQTMSIGSGCARVGVIAHEIGHSLGFYHEHSRPDRDKYIKINWSNVRAGSEFNFASKNWRFVDTVGVPFDYSSAMHYGAYDFSSNRKPTITAVDPQMQNVMGQRESLSFLDIAAANFKYCSGTCGGKSLEWESCRYGGYRDPNNCRECKCPHGFAPPFCSGVQHGVNAFCGRQYYTASSRYQTLSSPGYPNGYTADAECTWLIKAPDNKRIRLEFVGKFHIQPIRPTCWAYVEIRYKDLSRTGARYCWFTRPKDIFISHGSEALILLKTKKKGFRGFSIRFKTEQCGGCSRQSMNSEALCVRSEKYDCSAQVRTVCNTGPCTQTRKNYCILEVSHCCSGYEKKGNKCVRKISSPRKTTTTTRPRFSVITRLVKATTTTTRIPPRLPPLVPTRLVKAATTTTRPPVATRLIKAVRRTTTTTTPLPVITRLIRRTTTTKRPTTTTTTTTTPTPFPVRPPLPEALVNSDIWGPWSEWSQCSATCGLCGSSSRKRKCLSGNCSGKNIQAEICARTSCPDTPKRKIPRICDNKGAFCRWPLTSSSCIGSRLCFQTLSPLRCCSGEFLFGSCILLDLTLLV